VGSVAWVVSERGNSNLGGSNPRNYALGVLCGVGSAFGQALGLILSKRGMGGDFPALSASLIRLTTASVVIWLWALIHGQLRPTIEGLRIRQARRAIVGGTLVGPFIGMTFSLVAVQLTQVGIASTLMALSPVILLPLAHWIFKERITQRAIVGTVVAMVGVAMIFWT
jgi:drug/metabolite transporter (DMT)-like permease